MELILHGPAADKERRYTLANGETIIGRRPDCRIILNAPSISPRHARLFAVDGHVVIYAVDDASPVYINGEPTVRRVLAHEDEIELGHYRMRYVDDATAGNGEDASTTVSGTDEIGEPSTDVAAPVPAELTFTPAVDDDGDEASPGDAEVSDRAHDDVGGDATVTDLEAAPRPDSSPVSTPGWRDDDESLPADSGPVPRGTYHLDVLTGINRGRRVALTHDLVVLGFNRQRLVEIRNDHGTLSLRRVDDEATAELNGTPISEEPAEAKAGDVISLHRIDLRIHQEC